MIAPTTHRREGHARTALVQPFDITTYITRDGQGLYRLQDRIAMWLRGISFPTRFITWQMPADLRGRIAYVADLARGENDALQKRLLMETRRFYEQLQNGANYQRSICGVGMWTDETVTAAALASSLAGTFNTSAFNADFPMLFEGNYQLSPPNADFHHWHLRPVGRPGGRYYFALMSSYEFLPVSWFFSRPLAELLMLAYPIAICIDLPNTLDRNDAIQKIEGIKLATEVHLVTASGDDSRSRKKFQDCEQTLQQLNGGDLLHDVQIVIAVAAPDRAGLKRAVDEVVNRTKPYVRLRFDSGVGQLELAKFFGTTPTKKINIPRTTWSLVSHEAAMLFSPLGYRKLASIEGTLRGQSADGRYPFFFNSWGAGKKATHEVWVGQTGAGKTFSLNVFLKRQYVEEGVAFDLLEPMGHGAIIADAVGAPLFVPSPHETNLNPLDVMYAEVTDQVTHVIRLIETILGRQFSGTAQGNFQKGLIGQALVRLYGLERGKELFQIEPNTTPIVEQLCEALHTLPVEGNLKHIASELAQELSHLCTGAGPYARFLNARTNLDLSFRGKATPRIFSFHQMTADPELLALCYTQVLTAIRRDSLADEIPRTIAVDEVYRMLRHPSLLDFIIEAVKTFRTRRKKLIAIDQQMSIFLEGKARLVFENCPIRVVFNQSSGMQAFEDVAFNHLTDNHKDMIQNLRRGHFLLDVQDRGVFNLALKASPSELARFGNS